MKANRLLLDRVEVWFFSIPPSFYAIISGALIGAVINLLIGLIFAQEVTDVTILLTISFLLLSSSACFCIISTILEQLRAEVKGDDEATRKANFGGEIKTRRTILLPSLFMGVLVFGIVISMIFIFLL